MKYKIIILIAISAILTLSFTFAAVKGTKKSKATSETSQGAIDEAPVGGFVSEDKF